MKRYGIAVAAIAFGMAAAPGQTADALARIRQEGMDRSKVQALFATLTDEFGPRLAGSPAHKQAAEWERDRLREFGLSDPKLEPWAFGRGWVLDRLVVEMVEPRYVPLIDYAEAWSAPTNGEIVATPVVMAGRAPAEVAAVKDRLKGAIVLTQYNVLAEIPGVDPQVKSEVVLIGAHLDSWHTGTGASDNADGAAVVLEAMRILKTLGLQPRRTIRVALWGGEEEGLLGSKAYATQHLAGDANQDARDKMFAYLNIDPATGPIYGWYMQDSEPAKAIFDKWLEPLKDLGMRKNVIAGIGNTDHLSFRAVGVPGFNPIQEYKDYDVRMHHTNVDLYERVREQDLKQNAVVMAWFAWQAATTAERIPRP